MTDPTLPYAVAHLRQYPAKTLDTATLHNLRDECRGWLRAHVEQRKTLPPENLVEWDQTFQEDVVHVQVALNEISEALENPRT